MLSSIEQILQRMACRRAHRALRRANGTSWYLRELLRKRLELGLVTPSEVISAVGSWRNNKA
jgi:LytS/YehU family sensor histidine kinase